eukprot:scaffold17067_cov137-Skeletonema_marinoi.AAC.2
MADDLDWSRFPAGTEELMLSVVSSDKIKDVIIFIGIVDKLLVEDKTFNWRLDDFIVACDQRACDLFLQRKPKESTFMLFYAAVVGEYLARGRAYVINAVFICDIAKDVFMKFGILRKIADMVHYLEAMRNYFVTLYPDKQELLMDTNIGDMSKVDRFPFPLQKSYTLDSVKCHHMISLSIQVTYDEQRSNTKVIVYPDTPLNWLYLLCLYYGLTDNEDESWRSCLFSSPKKLLNRYLKSVVPYIKVNDETSYYLATSGKKTLGELGIDEGGFCVACMNSPPQYGPAYPESPPKIDTPSKKSTKKTGQRKKTKKKKQPAVQPPVNARPEPAEYVQKQAHSKAMNGVLEEMQPKLDSIRKQITSLSLHRTPPKKKKLYSNSKASVEKENLRNNMSFVEHSAAKAGKTAYPVLVSGEVSNIFKTSKQRRKKLSSRSDKIILDLHGMTKQHALELLEKSLPTWIDQAMKGDHPYVLPVDIICGGGSQLLSEVVANWIRNKPQVANRPKGYL